MFLRDQYAQARARAREALARIGATIRADVACSCLRLCHTLQARTLGPLDRMDIETFIHRWTKTKDGQERDRVNGMLEIAVRQRNGTNG